VQLDKLPRERKSISVFCNVVQDFTTRLRETHTMALEEKRSYQAAIHATMSLAKGNGRAEWLHRLILATQIQRQEAERLLTDEEAEYWRLSRACENQKCDNKRV
jgi:hypothetical protein